MSSNHGCGQSFEILARKKLRDNLKHTQQTKQTIDCEPWDPEPKHRHKIHEIEKASRKQKKQKQEKTIDFEPWCAEPKKKTQNTQNRKRFEKT